MGLFDQISVEEFRLAAFQVYTKTPLTNEPADEIMQSPKKRKYFIRRMRQNLNYFPMSADEEDEFEHSANKALIYLRKSGQIKTAEKV